MTKAAPKKERIDAKSRYDWKTPYDLHYGKRLQFIDPTNVIPQKHILLLLRNMMFTHIVIRLDWCNEATQTPTNDQPASFISQGTIAEITVTSYSVFKRKSAKKR
ncbi:hypothetical protein ACHAWX_003433 [Stephanocyclus meneghinianus]